MFKVANSILKNTFDAEEAVNEAFLRIAINFSKVSEANQHKARKFAVITVRNVAIDIYNKKKGYEAENI